MTRYLNTATFVTLATWMSVMSTGCGSADPGVSSGVSSAVGADGEGDVADSSGAPVDAGPVDSGPVDSGPEDSGPVDSGPEDSGPVDSGPEDSGPVDSGQQDTGPVDSGPAQDTQGQLCANYETKFSSATTAALKCTTPFSCTELAPAGLGCKGCELFYSHDDMAKVQAVHDVSSESTQKKCAPQCPKLCVDHPAKHVGVCGKDGTCTFDAPSCQEIEKRFKAVVSEGLKCSADSDCVFQAQTSLPCGCGAFLNMKTFGPGKPLFRYGKQLVAVYNAKKCFTGACACPFYSKAKCEKGQCVSLK